VAEVSYPTQGGGGVTDARYEQLIGAVMPSGLIGTTALSSLVYGDSSGRQVKVQPSRGAIVRGFKWETDGAGLTRSIAANSSGNPRIDLAVLRLNRTDYSVTFQVIQGSPSASPVAPAITQNTGSTGVWEMPLAQIAVANNATTITAANVTNVSWYVGGPNLIGTSAAFPTVAPGATFTATDTGKRYDAIGSAWHLTSENGALVEVTPAAGWTAETAVRVMRRNGWTMLKLIAYWNGSTRAPGSNVTICTLPAEYRSAAGSIYMSGHHNDADARFYHDAATGVVSLLNSEASLVSGNFVIVHPATWPSA
jgi:hypothetical protein